MTEFKSGVDLSLMEGVLRQYQDDSTSLIMILQQAQAIYGYLPQEVIYHVAERTGNSPAKVMGVATFYSYFRLKPMGIYQIMLCDGTACHVNGSDRIRAAITQELGIHNGETTEDGMFTLNEVACLGCCSLAPVMMINGDTYGNLTPEKTINILRQLRQRESGEGIRILVGQGSCGVSAGAGRVAKVLAGHMTATDSFTVETTGCIGMCYLEPIVDIYEGEKLLHRLVKVTETDALGIVEAVRKKDFSKLEAMFISDEDARFLKKQKRVALRHCGVVDPTSIDDYIKKDGYKAIDKALHMTPEEVIEEIKVSGLAGRGGAGVGGDPVPSLLQSRGRPGSPGGAPASRGNDRAAGCPGAGNGAGGNGTHRRADRPPGSESLRASGFPVQQTQLPHLPAHRQLFRRGRLRVSGGDRLEEGRPFRH